MTGPIAVVIPKEWYYHEVSYVRSLEARVKELESLLETERSKGTTITAPIVKED